MIETTFQDLMIRFSINLFFMILLIRGIYYRNHFKRSLILTYYSFNSILFFVSIILSEKELSAGAAFGLFAVFSMLRFRTESFDIKDMTYLFVSIALGLIMAISKGHYIQNSIIALILISIVFILENNRLFPQEKTKQITIIDLDLIKRERKTDLILYLEELAQVKINRHKIEDIDLFKNTCKVTIYYYENKN